jgi:hypothetical protein
MVTTGKIANEPDPPMIDEELHKEYTYTSDDFQMIHLRPDHPKG